MRWTASIVHPMQPLAGMWLCNQQLDHRQPSISAAWAGCFAITNNLLVIANGANGGLAIFASQTPASVGDFVCAKVVSISQGIFNGLAYVGLFNTNGVIYTTSRVALARYGSESARQAFSLGFYCTDTNQPTLAPDILKDCGDASAIFALGVSLDATNIVTGWVQGGRFGQQYGRSWAAMSGILISG